jgi:hypothetical protein
MTGGDPGSPDGGIERREALKAMGAALTSLPILDALQAPWRRVPR